MNERTLNFRVMPNNRAMLYFMKKKNRLPRLNMDMVADTLGDDKTFMKTAFDDLKLDYVKRAATKLDHKNHVYLTILHRKEFNSLTVLLDNYSINSQATTKYIVEAIEYVGLPKSFDEHFDTEYFIASLKYLLIHLSLLTGFVSNFNRVGLCCMVDDEILECDDNAIHTSEIDNYKSEKATKEFNEFVNRQLEHIDIFSKRMSISLVEAPLDIRERLRKHYSNYFELINYFVTTIYDIIDVFEFGGDLCKMQFTTKSNMRETVSAVQSRMISSRIHVL